MVDKCDNNRRNYQCNLDVNREILMKTSDMKNLGNAYRSIYEAKTKEEVSDNKEFVPHMMYDPETGKGYKAEKPEDHERMKKMGYTHDEPDMVKEKKLPRQMLDPKKDVMVVKNNKVIVIDKSKEKEFLKKGWGLAEQIDEAMLRLKFGKRLKVGDTVYCISNGEEGKITKIIGKHDRDSGNFEVKLKKSGKVMKKSLDQLSHDDKMDDVYEAVSPAQQAAIAISKKEKEEMKNEGSVKDLAMKIDKVVAKMNKDSKLKPFAKKFASMAMDTMDIEKSLEKALPSSVSGAKMISVLEKKLDPVDDAENDKKFKDRKDKDIDNDGDVDDSDEYLHNRRAKVDDAIDGGKKPAKKEEEEEKDPKKKVAKSPKVAEISKIGEDFVAMLEASLLEKAEPEAMDDKESPKGKEFIAKHKKSEKDLEDKEKEAQEETPKAGKATKEKSGKRAIDSTVGDKEVVKSTEAPIKEAKQQMTLVDMARAHLAGEKVDFAKGKKVEEKNPYDGRLKVAKEFMQRMDKRKGVK